MSEGTIKQVKVDNWGIFFLQRLQQLFAKSEHCDLVLQFSTNDRIKVHRLVLNACTEYFQMLEKQGHINGDALQMPSDFQPEVVIPIINFMYTGKLEFRTELHKRLYVAAQQMNMSVLTKLLDAQSAISATQIKPVIRKQPQMPITYNLQGKKIAPKHIDPDLPETLPGRKLPIWKRRNVPTNVPSYYEESSYGLFESTSKMPSIILDESPRPTRFDWPDENTESSSYSSSFDDLSYETKPIVKPVLVAKQTVPRVDTSQRVATFEEVCRTATNLKRFHSSPSNQDNMTTKKAKLDLQAVKEYVQEHRLRKVLLDTAEENGDEVEDDLAVADLDDDDDMDEEDGELSFEGVPQQSLQQTQEEHHEQQQEEQVQEQLEQTEECVEQTIIPQVLETVDQKPLPQTLSPHTLPPHAVSTTVLAVPSSPPPLIQQTPVRQTVLPPQKSILKPQGSHEESVPSTPVTVASKKVRFLLDTKLPEGKENTVTTPTTPKIRRSEDGQRSVPTRAENMSTMSGAVGSGGNLSNHAKIITEVLKKYPHLVKNNKNIRLKIMQRGGTQVAPVVPIDGDSSKVVKSKVSYVVLKSDVAGKGKSAVVLKHGGHVEPLSELGGQKPASGAENTTGPWLCHSCGSNEEPIHFETYYLYRRHLQDVHMEKIDARICEHCGHRASKRNLLLYHLYTKHGVPPPRNCQFPKCDQCDYVALSESLLIKHRNNHSNNKEFVCKVCNAAFKSNGALQGHMQTNLHSDPAKKLYECPFCQKPFVRNINLKAHIRTSHKDVMRKIDEEERLQIEAGEKQFGSLQHFVDGEEAHSSDAIGEDSINAEGEEEGEMMEVPVIDAVMQKPGTGTVMLPSGVTVLAEAPAVQSLVPSSEAEALSNVASGIAASLGLADTLTGEQTVIVLDENQEFVLHSTEIVGEETTSTEGKDSDSVGTELQEYIVPDIMPEDLREQQSVSYTGPLTNMEHYSSGHSSITVTSQTATAPPPVSVAVSVVGGDEVTMVLTDHDYAPIRDNGEGVMFFITRPAEHTDANNVAGTEPELPVLEKESEPPHLTAETSIPIPDTKFSNIPPVLTRETNDVQELQHRLSESSGKDIVLVPDTPQIQQFSEEQISQVVQAEETSTIIQLEETSTVVQAKESSTVVQVKETSTIEQVEETSTIEQADETSTIEQMEVERTEETIDTQEVENDAASEVRITQSINLEENVIQSGEVNEEIENEDDETIGIVIETAKKQPLAHSTPLKGQAPVRMADIMKEWDDFDEEDETPSEVQQSEQERKPVNIDTEPRILRGPLNEEH